MGNCQSAENRISKILKIKNEYPIYHRNQINDKTALAKYMEEHEFDLWEHYTKFIRYRDELEKNNLDLFQQLFGEVKPNEEKELKVSNVRGEDEEKIMFFVNKRDYSKIQITNCSLTFPRFSSQMFPRFQLGKSTLMKIEISVSQIKFEEAQEFYSRLDNLISLDLSYNNIEVLPDHFSKITKLRILSLRRNLLRSLPRSFENLTAIEELDLSENKFFHAPRELFSKNRALKKLNMNFNMLETFEYSGNGEGLSLEYLFLAQNLIAKIPLDIKKFHKLKHVILDDNKIAEKSHNLNEEIGLDVVISIRGNPHPESSKLIEVKKPAKTEPKKQIKKVNKVALTGENKAKETLNQKLEELKIKLPSTELEMEIAKKTSEIVDEMKLKATEFDQIQTEIQYKQVCFLVNKIKDLFETNRIGEVAILENMDLKRKFKLCNDILLHERMFRDSGKLPLRLDEMNPIEKEYFCSNILGCKKDASEEEVKKKIEEKRDKKISQREDISNLIFLSEVNHLLVKSKVKLYLQYLGNIDIKIRSFLINLLQEYDKNAFILILTELKLFITEMMEFYSNNDQCEDLFEIRFLHKIPKENNVIHKIFVEPLTLKILYRIGLSDKKNAKDSNDQDVLEFIISSSVHMKQKLVKNFLEKFIKIMKVTNMDTYDLD